MTVRCCVSNSERIFNANAAPVRCISAAKNALSTCLRRSRAISLAHRPDSHASRHSSSDSGSCPGAVNTSPRSITAVAMLRTSATPSHDTACCNETIGERGRNAGEFATRMISPASAGSDWISRASWVASAACCAVSSASCAQTRGIGAMFCGLANDWPKNAWAAWECKAETTTADGRLTSCTFHDDLVDLIKIGIGGGCLSAYSIPCTLLCQINMLSKSRGQRLRQIIL
jgi:hypothetical protein